MGEFERITGREKNGQAYYIGCFADDAPCGGGNPGDACLGCKYLIEQCERLAAYEESGLSPKQVREFLSARDRLPEPNRILTLDELKKTETDCLGQIPVWIEDSNENDVMADAIFVNDMDTKDYGKTWRCWLRNPTDEERSAAKWEGENK